MGGVNPRQKQLSLIILLYHLSPIKSTKTGTLCFLIEKETRQTFLKQALHVTGKKRLLPLTTPKLV